MATVHRIEFHGQGGLDGAVEMVTLAEHTLLLEQATANVSRLLKMYEELEQELKRADEALKQRDTGPCGPSHNLSEMVLEAIEENERRRAQRGEDSQALGRKSPVNLCDTPPNPTNSSGP